MGLADVSQSKFTDSALKAQRVDVATQDDTKKNSQETSDKIAPQVAKPQVALFKPAKVVARPVRSGQQVYAEEVI